MISQLKIDISIFKLISRWETWELGGWKLETLIADFIFRLTWIDATPSRRLPTTLKYMSILWRHGLSWKVRYARDRLRGLSEHESICDSRTAPCNSCGRLSFSRTNVRSTSPSKVSSYFAGKKEKSLRSRWHIYMHEWKKTDVWLFVYSARIMQYTRYLSCEWHCFFM